MQNNPGITVSLASGTISASGMIQTAGAISSSTGITASDAFFSGHITASNLSLAGTGGSDFPDLKAEFTDVAHTRGILSAARSASPDSANSQFFICFDAAPHLDRQYSAFGKVVKGMEFVDMIKKGDPNSGSVAEPDKIISLKSK